MRALCSLAVGCLVLGCGGVGGKPREQLGSPGRQPITRPHRRGAMSAGRLRQPHRADRGLRVADPARKRRGGRGARLGVHDAPLPGLRHENPVCSSLDPRRSTGSSWPTTTSSCTWERGRTCTASRWRRWRPGSTPPASSASTGRPSSTAGCLGAGLAPAGAGVPAGVPRAPADRCARAATKPGGHPGRGPDCGPPNARCIAGAVERQPEPGGATAARHRVRERPSRSFAEGSSARGERSGAAQLARAATLGGLDSKLVHAAANHQLLQLEVDVGLLKASGFADPKARSRKQEEERVPLRDDVRAATRSFSTSPGSCR